MIWKDATDFGIGKATKKNRDGRYCTFIVARYLGPGNVAKSYTKNVLKGKFSKEMCKEVSNTAEMAVKELERSNILGNVLIFHSSIRF